MITFITGKPGDGKSLYAVRNIIEDLVNTDVFVVTNIPLQMKTLNAYVASRWKRKDENGDDVPFVLDDRLKVIPDSEVYEFYRHRSGGLVLDWSPDFEAGQDGTKRLDRPEFVARMKANFLRIKEDVRYQRPVHYYIDEAHNFFSARDWATNGRGTLYYSSQHRHLHDNINLITQVMENVEKQLRGLASETHTTRNQLRRRLGPVRMRPVFRVFYNYGTPSPTVKPYDVKTFKLDASGIAACYQTVGALGVQSKPEEIKNNAPFPFWVLPVGAIAAVLGLMFLLFGGPLLANEGVRRGMLGGVMPKEVKAGLPVAPVQTLQGEPAAAPKRGEVSEVNTVKGPPVFVNAILRAGSMVTVKLSDGRVFSEDDDELERVGRTWAIVSGKKYVLRDPAPRPVERRIEPQAIEKPEEEKKPVESGKSLGSWRLDPDGVERLVGQATLTSTIR